MAAAIQLKDAILESLSKVIDPETGVDVVRMRLIEDLEVDEKGHVTYKFRPSSPLCPIAVPLSLLIRGAVASVPEVSGQEMEIVGYIQIPILLYRVITDSAPCRGSMPRLASMRWLRC